jgi:hypothetical protein
MGQVSKTYTFASGASILAEEFNTNYDTLYTEFNGKIDNTNIKTGAGITDDKLATITSANKVNISALTITGQKTGDITYFNGTAWTRLGTGAAGTVLRVNAGATAPEWS